MLKKPNQELFNRLIEERLDYVDCSGWWYVCGYADAAAGYERSKCGGVGKIDQQAYDQGYADGRNYE